MAQNNSAPNGWHPLGVPFCWQSKSTMRRIRDCLDGSGSVASGLATYVALTEIASDEGSDKFETTHAHVALKSGFSPRTVQDRTQDLVSIGVLHYSKRKLKGPGKYQLIHPNDQQPLPNDQQPLPNDQQPLPNDQQRTFQASLPPSEEHKEEPVKKQGEETPQFDPVPKRQFRREYQDMITDCTAAIKAVKENPKNYARDLTKEAEDLIAWLNSQGNTERAGKVMDDPASYERKNLKPKPAAIVDAWKARIEEIKRAMAGIVN
jgi:hypothetical protein